LVKHLACLSIALSMTSLLYCQRSQPGKPFFSAQGTYNKITSYSGTIGASGSVGIKFKNGFAAAVNAQLITFTGDEISYVPVGLQVSFVPTSIRPAPIFHATVGKGIYDRKLLLGINEPASLTGSIFFSAGTGIYVAAKKGGGILLTASYINAGFRFQEGRRSRKIASKEGFQIGLGFRI
jgi:hypothetical protein